MFAHLEDAAEKICLLRINVVLLVYQYKDGRLSLNGLYSFITFRSFHTTTLLKFSITDKVGILNQTSRTNNRNSLYINTNKSPIGKLILEIWTQTGNLRRSSVPWRCPSQTYDQRGLPRLVFSPVIPYTDRMYGPTRLPKTPCGTMVRKAPVTPAGTLRFSLGQSSAADSITTTSHFHVHKPTLVLTSCRPSWEALLFILQRSVTAVFFNIQIKDAPLVTMSNFERFACFYQAKFLGFIMTCNCTECTYYYLLIHLF